MTAGAIETLMHLKLFGAKREIFEATQGVLRIENGVDGW